MNSEGFSGTGVIGVISDTHGMLRPEAARIFSGVDIIIHAGDIGSLDVLRSLESIAPVTAVHGNMDSVAIASLLNASETFDFKGFRFHLIHDLSHLDIDPVKLGVRMIISGHSHTPVTLEENDILYLNPGSAGPKRLNKPVSLAKVTVQDLRLLVRHYNLEELK